MVITVLLSGCGTTPEKAREELGKMNIQYTNSSFVNAASNNDTMVIDYFIKSGMSPNVQDTDGKTALAEATRLGHSGIAKMLFENGADPTLKDRAGMNALYYAAADENKFDLLQSFLSKKADINALTNNKTLLMTAAENGNNKAIDLLLSKGADINIKNQLGETALSKAVVTGSIETVKLLLNKGANPKDKIQGKGSLSTLAAYSGYREITEMLINKGTKEMSLLVLPEVNKTEGVKENEVISSNPELHFTKNYNSANPEVTYNLDGKGQKLTFRFQNDQEHVGWFNPYYRAKVIVKGDGKVLLESGFLEGGKSPKEYSVEVKGIKNLTLSVHYDSKDGLADNKSTIFNPVILVQ